MKIHFFCTTQKIALFAGRTNAADVPAIIRDYPLADFPVLDFVTHPNNGTGKFMAAYGVKLIGTAVDIVVFHIRAADGGGFDFNHHVIRAAHRFRYVNHLIAAKGLTKSCQCFHCVFLCLMVLLQWRQYLTTKSLRSITNL